MSDISKVRHHVKKGARGYRSSVYINRIIILDPPPYFKYMKNRQHLLKYTAINPFILNILTYILFLLYICSVALTIYTFTLVFDL